MTDTSAPAPSPRTGLVDPRRRVALALTVVALVAGVGFLGFTRLVPAAGSGAAAGTGAAAGSGAASAPGTLTVGGPAPELSGTTLDGATLSLASLRGRPVVVNFWASWCAPCKGEFPAFKSVLARHQADGLEIVGVLFNDGAAPARAFVAAEGATWPTVLDPGGSAAKTFQVFGAPESFLIDRSGIVRSRILGGLTESSLEQSVATILR